MDGAMREVDNRHQHVIRQARDRNVHLAGRYAAGGMMEKVTEIDLPRLVVIGTIHTPYQQPEGMPVQGTFAGEVEGEVRLDPSYKEGLADIDGFSHLTLIYAFHRSRGHRLTVVPYLDPNPRGLFATRAPRRPNPIGMSVVRLMDVDGCRLRVAGVDMLEGTPLLDIKPHVPIFDSPKRVRVGWLEPHLSELQRGGKTLADRRFHSNDDEDPL